MKRNIQIIQENGIIYYRVIVRGVERRREVGSNEKMRSERKVADVIRCSFGFAVECENCAHA